MSKDYVPPPWLNKHQRNWAKNRSATGKINSLRMPADPEVVRAVIEMHIERRRLRKLIKQLDPKFSVAGNTNLFTLREIYRRKVAEQAGQGPSEADALKTLFKESQDG